MFNVSKIVTGYAQQLYLFAESGLRQAKKDGAHFWYIDGSLPEEYPENWSTQRINRLLTQIQLNNIKPILHGNFKIPLASDIASVRESAIKNVMCEIDLACELSAPLILHGGAIVEPRLVIKAKKMALDHYLKALEAIINYAATKKVTILLENLSNYKNYRPFHYIFTNIEEYEYIFDRIMDDHVHFFFDIGHGVICEGNPMDVIHRFHRRIWGMSFSNNDGVRDLHLGINRGIIDYQLVVDKIREVQWKGIVAFEVRGQSFQQNIVDFERLAKKSFTKSKDINYLEYQLASLC